MSESLSTTSSREVDPKPVGSCGQKDVALPKHIIVVAAFKPLSHSLEMSQTPCLAMLMWKSNR
jgi:hypothetical protein